MIFTFVLVKRHHHAVVTEHDLDVDRLLPDLALEHVHPLARRLGREPSDGIPRGQVSEHFTHVLGRKTPGGRFPPGLVCEPEAAGCSKLVDPLEHSGQPARHRQRDPSLVYYAYGDSVGQARWRPATL